MYRLLAQLPLSTKIQHFYSQPLDFSEYFKPPAVHFNSLGRLQNIVANGAQVSQAEIEIAVKRVAEIVDEQNSGVSGYIPIADTQEKRDRILSNPAIASVLEVIDEALTSPSAYVEPALFKNHRAVQAAPI